MIEQVGGLMSGLTAGGGGARSGANNGANSSSMAPNDTIYLCNFRQISILFTEGTLTCPPHQ